MIPDRREPLQSDLGDLSPGDVLGGKFRVERVVGRGGVGVVVEATNLQLGQRVALKLLAAGANDPAIVERFSLEARAAARLRSEHVARVFDVGRDPVRGPFIVMEMLDGKTLADVVASTGRLPVHRAVEYVIDACEGLAEAHARGIVHRDVKPANLFLVTGDDGRPTIKLLDFGIAMMRSTGSEKHGKSSQPSLGTPAYLAPEQLRGSGPVDHRADIWALGCVLYELLSGERPFRASRFTQLVTRIVEEAPAPLPNQGELPAGLVATIERCLAKAPELRFGNTGALALALLPFARRRAHSAVSRAVAHVKAAGLAPDLHMPSSMPPQPAELPSEAVQATALRAPRVPSFPDQLGVPAAEAAPRPPRTRVAAVLAGLALVAAGLALGVRALPGRTTHAAPSSTRAPSDPGSPAPSAPPRAPPSPAPPPIEPPPAAAPVPPPAPTPPPAPSASAAPRPALAPPRPAPSTSASGLPEFEIRHDR